jgi:GntR family transcriptional regulator
MPEAEVPKYLVIYNSIINRIKNNELIPGSKVPSENEIIKEFNAGNTTARKVLQEIGNEGWAVKIRGKGTFVKEFIIDRSRIQADRTNLIFLMFEQVSKVRP